MTGTDEFDYVVVGGGTAGCVLANRLSADPAVRVLLLEWGPDDADEPRAQSLRRWADMLEGEYDLDYRSVENVRGNSGIRQSRARIIGGCSTCNTMIAWKPLRSDLDEWVALGAVGWTPEALEPAWERLSAPIAPVGAGDRNPHVVDVVEAASKALGLPVVDDWNRRGISEGAGFFDVGYDPATNQRSSASHSYLHPVEDRPNLVVRTERRAVGLVVENGRCTGVRTVDAGGAAHLDRARAEVIVACGAIDTPRLLQLSGIGPRDVLEAAGVPVVVDSPGVGRNLQDHAEGMVVFEIADDIDPTVCASGWDGGYVVRVEEGRGPDVSTHAPVEAWTAQLEAAGIELPERLFALAPNVAKPASRGRVWITSADPDVAPSIDYGSFTDPDGHDERMLVEGVRLARRVAAAPPLAARVVREVFPGPGVTSDEDVSAAERAVHNTVYHVSCTARMGADGDPEAVLDERLRVRGVAGLRVADASAFPTLTALNPVITIMVLAERAAELVLEDAAATRSVDASD
ncbi:GMC family oxidoreductase [Pseudoclavibacter chungangensis]|uniref:GMC family oxidoreductase n=1 Tax=Pseudoclavibacter chungangensis TaxID=587635 RepID=A0A7J5BSG3_9MICO|nr:GMC family oxidoreductase [Pseudoclavibacter chungangensis]KAB1655674.1 GMC family oxidoreductase [Pseudoclavibacter chungangensis]NYJ67915.1 choline dehydrogenase-like flavoprotein [Pseudoclavibacter chungangensis]